MENLNEFQIPEEALKKLKDPQIILQHIEDGKTFQELIGYTDETMQKFYEVAHRLFSERHYKESADAFIFLTTLNPNVHNYWLGLGMAEHLNAEYHAALMAYGMAILTDVENPLPHYHSAGCYQLLDDKMNALQSLELAISYAGDKKEFTHVKERAIAVKSKLSKK